MTGTCIDGFVTEECSFQPEIHVAAPGTIAKSDHAFLHTFLPHSTTVSYGRGFGRVWWATGGGWSDALDLLDTSLTDFASAVEALSGDTDLIAMSDTRRHQKTRRRILDLTTWIRDSWYAITGHLCSVVKIATAPRPTSTFLSAIRADSDNESGSDSQAEGS